MDARFVACLACLIAIIAADTTPPTHTQKIESFHVVSDIQYRFATTQIVSLVRNTAEEGQEIKFGVTLPKEAFIMHFAMTIDGKVYEGEVKEKQEAKRQYQAAVDRGESAGHVAQTPRHASVFDVSVHVASGSLVNFTLTYQELLRRTLGLYQHEIHMSPGQPVGDFKVKVLITDKNLITTIKTPTLKKDFLISNTAAAVPTYSVSVTQTSPTTAYIEYSPALTDQGDKGLTARFLVQYDVEHGKTGDLLMVDGYFVHFFAPELPSMPKDIIFVLDKSGSMMGRKTIQLKDAMHSILQDLKPEDHFNIISFSDKISKWKSNLHPADNDIKAEADRFVDSIHADGGTDINGALLAAVRELQKRKERTRAPMIFFLTDGEATSGVTLSSQITLNVMSANEGVVSIFSLAFGDGADYSLLKTIGAQNSGFARKIYEASDSALQVTTLYNEIAVVVMKDLKIEYLNSNVDEFSTTQTEFPVVFNGSEIIICWPLLDREIPTSSLEFEITGVQKTGNIDLRFSTEDIQRFTITEDPEDIFSDLIQFEKPRDFAGIVERMWAFLNIKQMFKAQEKNEGNKEEVNDLKRKIIDMAVKYKFVTPLTSMVVTKPQRDGQKAETSESDLRDVDSSLSPDSLSSRSKSSGRRYVSPSLGIRRQYALPSHVNRRKYALPSRVNRRLIQPDAYQVAGYPGLPDYEETELMDGLVNLVPAVYPMNTITARPQRRSTYRPSTRKPTPTKPRGCKNNKNVKCGQRKNKRKVKYPILSRIVVDTPTNTFCAVPKKWLPGNYSVVTKPARRASVTGPPLLVEIISGKGRLTLLNSISLFDGTTVTFNDTGSAMWRYSPGTHTTIAIINGGKTLQFLHQSLNAGSQNILEIEFLKQKGRKRLYSLVIHEALGDEGKTLWKMFRSISSNKGVRRNCALNNGNFQNIGVVSRKKVKRLAFKKP